MKEELTDEQWKEIFKTRDEFIEKTTGRTSHKYQKQFSDAVLKSVLLGKGDTIVSQWARQSAKTTTFAEEVAVFLLLFYYPICKQYGLESHPFFNIAITGPKFQQAEAGYNKVRNLLRKCHEIGFGFEFENDGAVWIKITSKNHPIREVYCISNSPTSNQESKTVNLAIYDEGQDQYDEVIERAIVPMGAMTNMTQIWCGVGVYRKCLFLKKIQENDPGNTFVFDYEKIEEEYARMYKLTEDPVYLNFSKFIAKQKRDLGEESDAFRTQFKLHSILERGQFIIYKNIMQLEAEYEIYHEYKGMAKVYGGIDWGKSHDSTVFTIVDEECRVIAWYEWQGDDYASQIEEIEWLIKNKYTSMHVVHCDSTGNQDMGVDMLRKKLQSYGVQVEGVHFSATSKDEMYKNLSRLMHNKYIGGNLIEEAKMKFPIKSSPQKEKFIMQMLDLQKEIRGDKWRCQHPEAPGKHDDYCDSAALAYMAFIPRKDVTKGYKPMIGFGGRRR